MGACPALSAFTQKFNRAHAAGLEEIAQGMASQTAESLEAHRFLRVLRELLLTGRCILVNRHQAVPAEERDRIVGYHDDDNGAWLFPDGVMRAVTAHLGKDGLNGISDVTLRRQLHSVGALASWTDARLTKIVKIDGNPVRFIHLAPGALAGDDNE